MDLSLQILDDLLKKMSSEPSICTQFFQSFYITLLEELLVIMTDCRHLAGFKKHVTILQLLVQIVD